MDGEFIKNQNLIKIDEFNKNDLVCKELILKDQFGNFLIKTVTMNNNFEKLPTISGENYKKFFTLKDNRLILKNKNTLINKSIIIPSGYIVNIFPGEKINLINNAIIFSNSPWLVDGGDDLIIISGYRDNFGGGLHFVNVKEKSYFKNVKFEYLSGLKNLIFTEILKNT